MKVSALAEELGLKPSVLLRMCRDRGIRASWEESELSDDATSTLRQAMHPDDGPEPGTNPAVVASFDNLPPSETAPAPPPPAPAHDDDEDEDDPRLASVPAVEGAVVASAVAVGAAGASSEPGGPASPEFGSIDPRYASMAAVHEEAPIEEESRKPAYTPELSTALKSLVIAYVFAAIWVFARFLDRWHEGHWWLVPVVCALFVAVAGLRALVLGVHGVSEVVRYPRARRGKVECGICVFLAAAVLLGCTLLGIYDWTAIRVPDAYHRLSDSITHTQHKTSSQLDSLGGNGLTTTVTPEGTLAGNLKVGQCLEIYLGTEAVSDAVSCTSLHRYEVAGYNTPAAGAYQGSNQTQDQANLLCTPVYTKYVGVVPAQSKYAMVPTYPSKAQWTAGDRQGLCLVMTPENFTDSVHNSHK